MLEQQSLYEDLDNLDQVSEHCCIFDHDQHTLLAYARLRLDTDQQTAFIERVVVAQEARGCGFANQLLQACISRAEREKKLNLISLSAQTDALSLYEKWGFEGQGGPYDDGGIMHLRMIRKLR